jgi:hypothetical protein
LASLYRLFGSLFRFLACIRFPLLREFFCLNLCGTEVQNGCRLEGRHDMVLPVVFNQHDFMYYV